MKIKSAAALAAAAVLPALVAVPLTLTSASAAPSVTKCTGYPSRAATLTLSASKTNIKVGQKTTVFGNLKGSNCEVVGGEVTVFVNGHKVSTKLTNAEGAWSYTYKAKDQGYKNFHAIHPAGKVAGKATSRYVDVHVKKK